MCWINWIKKHNQNSMWVYFLRSSTSIIQSVAPWWLRSSFFFLKKIAKIKSMWKKLQTYLICGNERLHFYLTISNCRTNIIALSTSLIILDCFQSKYFQTEMKVWWKHSKLCDLDLPNCPWRTVLSADVVNTKRLFSFFLFFYLLKLVKLKIEQRFTNCQGDTSAFIIITLQTYIHDDATYKTLLRDSQKH